MSEQPGDGDDAHARITPGTVRFEGDVLLTFDGADWVPMIRVADLEPDIMIRGNLDGSDS